MRKSSAKEELFYNEAVLRAFEKISGREVVRPSIAGLMGAYGAALIALENYEIGEVTALLSSDELSQFTAEKEFTHCGLCENNCMLTVTLFSDGRKFITRKSLRAGVPASKSKKEERKINLVDYKYRRLFKYRPLRKKEASRGRIGIPRVLNLYETIRYGILFLQNWASR